MTGGGVMENRRKRKKEVEGKIMSLEEKRRRRAKRKTKQEEEQETDCLASSPVIISKTKCIQMQRFFGTLLSVLRTEPYGCSYPVAQSTADLANAGKTWRRP
jgi:hypothetical protein